MKCQKLITVKHKRLTSYALSLYCCVSAFIQQPWSQKLVKMFLDWSEGLMADLVSANGTRSLCRNMTFIKAEYLNGDHYTPTYCTCLPVFYDHQCFFCSGESVCTFTKTQSNKCTIAWFKVFTSSDRENERLWRIMKNCLFSFICNNKGTFWDVLFFKLHFSLFLSVILHVDVVSYCLMTLVSSRHH